MYNNSIDELKRGQKGVKRGSIGGGLDVMSNRYVFVDYNYSQPFLLGVKHRV
jgi:hypothetical protein